MKNEKQIFSTVLTVVISVFLVSLGVYAATTIGTNIETAGTLDVTGATTLSTASTSGNFWLGNVTADDDDHLYMDASSSEYLMWDDDPGQFDFSDDLKVNGNATTTGDFVISGGDLNKDGTALTLGGAVTLNGTTATGLTLSGTNSTAGIQISPTVTASSMTGLKIVPVVTGQSSGDILPMQVDYDYSGGDVSAYGMDIDIQQTGETTSGALGSRGNIIGIRSDVRVANRIDDAYGLYGKVYIDPAAAEEVNQLTGLFGWIEIKGTLTKAGTAPLTAIRGEISNGSTGSFNGDVYGIDISYGSSVNYGGETAGVRVYTHGDANMDYGYYVKNISPNLSKGLYITNAIEGTGVIATGIDINPAGYGAITTGMSIGTTTTAGITIATSTTGIDLSGDYTTAGISIGGSADKAVLAAYDDHAVDIWTTNAVATAATVRSVELNQIHTGAGVSRAEAFTSILTTDVAMGTWANAILGKIDFQTDGSVTGLAGVICAELGLPVTAPGHGEYSVYEAEIDSTGSSVTSPIHVFEVNSWGDNKALVDTYGYLFDLDGFVATSGQTKMITNTSFTDFATMSGEIGIRIKVEDTAYYLIAVPVAEWN